MPGLSHDNQREGQRVSRNVMSGVLATSPEITAQAKDHSQTERFSHSARTPNSTRKKHRRVHRKRIRRSVVKAHQPLRSRHITIIIPWSTGPGFVSYRLSPETYATTTPIFAGIWAPGKCAAWQWLSPPTHLGRGDGPIIIMRKHFASRWMTITANLFPPFSFITSASRLCSGRRVRLDTWVEACLTIPRVNVVAASFIWIANLCDARWMVWFGHIQCRRR